MTSAHWNLAWLNLETGRTGEALQVFDEAIAFDSTHAFAYYGKALMYYFSDQFEKADECFEKAAQLDTRYIYARQAGAALQQAAPGEAVRLLKKAIEVLNDDNLRYLLCRLYAQQGRSEEALDMLEPDLNTTYAAFPWMETGGRSYAFMQRDSALRQVQQTHRYQQLMRRHFPEKFDDLDSFAFEPEAGAYYLENCVLFASVYRSMGEPQKANSLLEKAIDLARDTASGARLFHMAKGYLQLGRIAEAKQVCPDGLETAGKDDVQTAAEVYYLLQEYDKAARSFAQYAGLVNYKAPAYLDIGRFYALHGAYEPAARYLQAARAAAKRDFMMAYQELAWLEFSAGHSSQAVQYLETAENIDPADRDTRFIKTIFIYFTLPADSARALFLATEKAHPGFLPMWDFLEQVRRKKYAEAAGAYPKVKAAFSEGWIGCLDHIYLAALVQSGDLELAAKVLNETNPYFLNYPLVSNQTLLAPLRGTEAYRKFIKVNFPEKAQE